MTPTLLDSNNTYIRNKCYEVTLGGSNWWYCGELLKGNLFLQHKSYTGLSAFDSMHIIQEYEDSVTMFRNIKYQQYFKGIPLEYVIYHEHSLRDTVILTTGFLCEGMIQNSNPSFEEGAALNIALNYLNSKEYAWENESLEQELKNDSNATDTTYFPKGKLLWALINDTLSRIIPSNYSLAWHFQIYRTDSLEGFYDVYVNAQTGSILKFNTISRQQGSFNHYIYGSKNMDTRWLGGSYSKYYLETDEDVIKVKTKNSQFKGSYKTHNLTSDNDDNWGNDNWAATASHWAVTEAWKFWKSDFKRNGFDDGGVTIRVQSDNVKTSQTTTKPGTGYDIISIGKRNGIYEGAIDIIGHEFTHGVIAYTGKMNNAGEPGSIAESTADIFGMLLEKKLFSLDFIIGEDGNPNYARHIENPQNISPPIGSCLSKYPRYFLESNAFASYICSGAMHHNANVQNQCFYFLALGGNLNGVSVSGIGLDKAVQILHLALIEEYKPLTNFVTSREGWINAAIKLFGRCSAEHLETCKAWAAVNVGNTCFCIPPGIEILPCFRDVRKDPGAPEVPNMKTTIFKTLKDIIYIYPSPAEDNLNVDFGVIYKYLFTSSAKITIFDNLGREAYHNVFQLNSQIQNIDLTNFGSGIYVIYIQIEDSIFKYKFIKS